MDLLTKQRQEAGARLDELRARVTTLELVDAALAGVSSDAIAQARATLGLDRGPVSNGAPPARKSERREEVLGVVRNNPAGISAPGIAARLDVPVTLVYGPLKALEGAALVVKKGREWLPVNAPA